MKMKRIEITLNGNIMPTRTQIYIGDHMKETFRKIYSSYGKILFLVSRNIKARYDDILSEYTDGSTIRTVEVSDGEDQKNLDAYYSIISTIMENSIERGDAIAYAGGGTLGDVTGFASASYMRGIDLLAFPTTLLAQVDSSIGGKNGVNFHGVKNLIGTFHNPVAVFCDTRFIKRSEQGVVLDSLGELLKYGFIGNPAILGILESHKDIADLINTDLENIIELGIMVKKKFVEADPLDTGERKILNFGHTFGHVIEACSSGRIPHGNAVLLGIMAESEFGQKVFGIKDICSGTVRSFMKNYGIRIRFDYPFKLDEIPAYLNLDKKSAGNSITMSFVDSPGHPVMKNAEKNEASLFLRDWLSNDQWK